MRSHPLSLFPPSPSTIIPPFPSPLSIPSPLPYLPLPLLPSSLPFTLSPSPCPLGAAFSPIADAIVSIDQWAKGKGAYVTQRSVRGIVGYLIEPFTPFAKRSHRLALCLSATYGRTLSKASGDLIKVRSGFVGLVCCERVTSWMLSVLFLVSVTVPPLITVTTPFCILLSIFHYMCALRKSVTVADHYNLILFLFLTFPHLPSLTLHPSSQEHPEILEILTDDTTCYILSCTGKEIAALASLLGCIGLLLERTDGSYFSLFLVVSFLLVLSGIRLALNVYKSACDAIIVAFFLQPERLRLENQIVYLRFLRRSEMALR